MFAVRAMDSLTRHYSDRLGTLTGSQLQDAADRFGLGTVTGAEAASGGLFGQNVFLTTTTGEFVLRGNPHGHVQLTKERRVARLIDERSSLPVPWPYEVCDDPDLFGWTYAVMPRLPGESAADLREAAGEDDRLRLAAAMGEALAQLHEARSDSFGPYDAQLDDFIAMDDFPDWFLHRLEHWRTACRAVNALSAEAEQYIDELIEQNAGALDEPFVPVLVHHDFAPGNVNLARTESGFEPTGVFDLMEAYIADGEEDLVRMLWNVRPPEAEAFLRAYVRHNPLRPGAAERLQLYMLCDWLVIWEYGRRVGEWFEDIAFVDSARPKVEFAAQMGTMS